MKSRKYETVFVLKPNLDEESTKAVVEKFKNLLEKSAKLEKIDEWGKKKLAYTAENFDEGYYVLAEFEATPEFPRELERIYKITDEVFRYLVVRKD